MTVSTERERCETCDRPFATDAQWSGPDAHGQDGDGCSCDECIAVCWGECIMAGMSVDWRTRAIAAESALAAMRERLGNVAAAANGYFNDRVSAEESLLEVAWALGPPFLDETPAKEPTDAER